MGHSPDAADVRAQLVVILYKLWFMAVARRRVPQAVAAFWQMPDLVRAMAQVEAAG
jgi:biopolymer transport protein ExbB